MTVNRVLVLAAAVIIAVLFASALFGQETSKYSVELLMGSTNYDRDALFLEDGVTVEANAVRMLSQHVGAVAGGSFGFTETDLEVFRPCESCAAIADQTGMDVTVLEAHAGLRAYLVPQSARVRPYVEGGFGWYRFYSDAEDYDDKGAWEIRAVAGLQARLQRDVGLAVTFGYSPLQCDLFDRTAQADVLSAKIGVTYNHGWEPVKLPPIEQEIPKERVAPPCTDYPPDVLQDPVGDGRNWVHFGADRDRDPVTLMQVGYYAQWLLLAERGDKDPFEVLWLQDRCGILHRYETEQKVQGTTG